MNSIARSDKNWSSTCVVLPRPRARVPNKLRDATCVPSFNPKKEKYVSLNRTHAHALFLSLTRAQFPSAVSGCVDRPCEHTNRRSDDADACFSDVVVDVDTFCACAGTRRTSSSPVIGSAPRPSVSYNSNSISSPSRARSSSRRPNSPSRGRRGGRGRHRSNGVESRARSRFPALELRARRSHRLLEHRLDAPRSVVRAPRSDAAVARTPRRRRRHHRRHRHREVASSAPACVREERLTHSHARVRYR